MDKLYFTSFSVIFTSFCIIRAESLTALATLPEVATCLNRASPEKYEFGLYMGAAWAELQKKDMNIPAHLNNPRVKKCKETFENLNRRTLELVDKFELTIPPPSLQELHGAFRKVIDLHLEGYRIVLELLEKGDIILLPQVMNIFEECNSTLMMFEKIQRSVKTS